MVVRLCNEEAMQVSLTWAASPSSSAPGHYMYVDSVYAKHFQEVAKLTSPMTMIPMAGCLSFYYQRDQERGNIFSVFTRDQLGHYDEIWRPEVYATAGWTLVSVDIKAPHPLEVWTAASMHIIKHAQCVSANWHTVAKTTHEFILMNTEMRPKQIT